MSCVFIFQVDGQGLYDVSYEIGQMGWELGEIQIYILDPSYLYLSLCALVDGLSCKCLLESALWGITQL